MRNHMWNQFKKLYQPYENVAIDEQIVISNNRSGLWEYMLMKMWNLVWNCKYKQRVGIVTYIILRNT